MPHSSYAVPAEVLEKTLTIKKSRFIACVKAITSRDDAKAFLEYKKTEYPDARHHCWAYLIGNPKSALNAAMSDDGEPSGTAGKPILNVIQHKNIGDVMVLVTRYFGGVKLGAGGLTRAYSGATEMILSALVCEQKVFLATAYVDCGFSQEQMLRYWAGQHNTVLTVVNYSHQVELKMELPYGQRDNLVEFCQANALIVKLL